MSALTEAEHESLIEAIQNGDEATWVAERLAAARSDGYGLGWKDRHSEVDYGTSLAGAGGGAMSDLRAAAEWLVGTGYPFDFNFTPRAPEPLWQAIIDVVHDDADGGLHGNELTREQVADWLLDP